MCLIKNYNDDSTSSNKSVISFFGSAVIRLTTTMAIVDKMGVYKTASAGVKAGLEKKADLKVQKSGAKWATRLRPEIKKRMKDAFRARTHVKNPEG